MTEGAPLVFWEGGDAARIEEGGPDSRVVGDEGGSAKVDEGRRRAWSKSVRMGRAGVPSALVMPTSAAGKPRMLFRRNQSMTAFAFPEGVPPAWEEFQVAWAVDAPFVVEARVGMIRDPSAEGLGGGCIELGEGGGGGDPAIVLDLVLAPSRAAIAALFSTSVARIFVSLELVPALKG